MCAHKCKYTHRHTYTCVWRSKIDIICFSYCPLYFSRLNLCQIPLFDWSALLASPRKGPAYPVQHHLTFYVGVWHGTDRQPHSFHLSNAEVISVNFCLLESNLIIVYVVIQLSAYHLLNHLKSQFYQHTARYSIKRNLSDHLMFSDC